MTLFPLLFKRLTAAGHPPLPGLLLCLLVLLLPAQYGCAAKNTYPNLQEVAPATDTSFCRVAILPFLNSSAFAQADKIASRIFQAELARKINGITLPEGDILRLYQQLRLYTYQQPDSEHIRIIRERLNADVIISGSVTEMKETPSADGINPVVAVQFTVHDARTGKMLAIIHHRRDGDYYRKIMHFGKVNTITQLTKLVFEEAISLCLQNGLFSCQSS